MMKLVLSLTLIWTLSSTAGALQCQTCTNVNCSSTESQTCPSETMCVTAVTQATLSGTTAQQILKGCALSSVCPTTDSQTLSFNFGILSEVTSAKCCNTDSCNSETLPFPAAQTDNSLQCFTCDPLTFQCNSKLQCKGVQNRCFQAEGTTGSSSILLFGCVSANLCKAFISQGSLPSSVTNFTSGPSCCETSLCNTAPTTTSTQPATTTTTASDACCIRLGLIHVLLGLLIFTLY